MYIKRASNERFMPNIELLKIILLAASSDGRIQTQEREMINQFISQHPYIKGISKNDLNLCFNEIKSKINAGMKTKYLIQDIGENLNQIEKNTAYALAFEICAVDLSLDDAETIFMTELESIWSIDEEIKRAVKLSVKLRYTK